MRPKMHVRDSLSRNQQKESNTQRETVMGSVGDVISIVKTVVELISTLGTGSADQSVEKPAV
ncbi:hypothetical protein RE2895_62360 (plasmid) [Rhodococcus erythropolis]|nr:hypothetical protein RE2895_62360 [Rhodococcus erythropolis]